MNRRRLSVFFWLLAAAFAAPARTCLSAIEAPRVTPPQFGDYDGLDFYRKAKPIVAWSPAEVTKAMPELKGFKPAESQEALPLILSNVGDNVATFFHNFVNTASVEVTHQVRMRDFGSVEVANYMKLNYLFVPVQGRNGIELQEYRTDSHGKSAKIADETREFILTTGFADRSVYFHPKHQPFSTFRYLGRKMLKGRDTLLVLFAQHPERDAVLGRVKFGNESIPILVQGVAWIDAASYEIVRMRTDLLAPLSNVHLEQATTDIWFEGVRFKELRDSMWLPREVNVTVKRGDRIYHNQHRYSEYRLFKVEAGDKSINKPAAQRPQ